MPTTLADFDSDTFQHNLWREYPEVFSFLDHLTHEIVFDVLNNYPATVQAAWEQFNAGYLTTLMRRAVERFLRRQQGNINASMPAYPFDAANIPNGTFRLRRDDGEDFEATYQIYTVQSGRWTGRRVIKIRDEIENGIFKAYGFLNGDGTWTVWNRFRATADQWFACTYALLEGLSRISTAHDRTLRRETSHTFNHGAAFYVVETIGQHCLLCNDDGYGGFCSEHAPAGTVDVEREARTAHQNVYYHSDEFDEEEDPLEEDENVPRISYRSGQNRLERSTPLPLCEITGVEIQ